MKRCAIGGCCGEVASRGLCRKHYERWKKYGDPLGGGTYKGEASAFLENHKNYSGDECLIWPYTKDSLGYGYVKKSGRKRTAQSVMLELAVGPKPTPEHESAHSCGNRACVNPRHLRWATHRENEMDKVSHGTLPIGEHHGMAKLTKDKVIEIRKLLKEGVSQSAAGRLYGMSQPQISLIGSGKSWGWIKDKGAEQ